MSFGYRSDGDAMARLRRILILQCRYASGDADAGWWHCDIQQPVNATEQFNVRNLRLVQSKIFVISRLNATDSRGNQK